MEEALEAEEGEQEKEKEKEDEEEGIFQDSHFEK